MVFMVCGRVSLVYPGLVCSFSFPNIPYQECVYRNAVCLHRWWTLEGEVEIRHAGRACPFRKQITLNLPHLVTTCERI